VCSALGCVRCCAGFAAGGPGCVGPLGRARVYFAPPPHMCCRVRAMNFGCQQPGTHFVESVVGLVVSFSSTKGRVLLREKTTHRRVLFSTTSIAFHELHTGTGYQSTRQGLRRGRVSYDFSPARHQREMAAAEILWHHGLLGEDPLPPLSSFGTSTPSTASISACSLVARSVCPMASNSSARLEELTRVSTWEGPRDLPQHTARTHAQPRARFTGSELSHSTTPSG
jgi:hypothetical protein